MARVTSALLSLLLTFTTAEEFGIEDIVPDHRVVAQIGHKLALSCRTTDCESPYFSWRTQLDHPLGGKLSNQGKSSVLTMQSVGFQHEHQYVCTAGCKRGEPSKEKAVRVDIYSFPSDPVIELKSPLILGQPASVTCRVPKVYPSEQLMITLIKGKLSSKKEFFQDPHTKSLETKNLKMDFIPTEEDFGKEIICTAELHLEDMAPKLRQSTHVMEINSSVFSTAASTLTTQSETTAFTTPSETTVFTTPSETTVFITPSETTVFITPSETTVLNTASETTTSFTSDAASETITSVTSRATLKTFVSATSEIATPELITMSASDTAPKIITSVTSHAALKNNTVVYLVGVSDDDRNNTEEIIIIARVEELDYVIPVIIVVSCLATVAGPAAAIFIYIFRKMKINGSYSLKPNI